MIYQIKSDKNILYDLRDDAFFVEDPILSLEINKVGTLNFTIYPDHPYFDRLEKLKSRIEAYRDGKIIFRGRIISEIQGIYNSKSIECESALAYLNDSIVRPGEFKGTPEELFTFAINNHNSQVSENQQLKLGTVTVKDPNDYINRSWSDYISTFDLINTRCLDSLGGYLVERYEEDGTYVDWLEDFTEVAGQNIEFGENLMDILATNDASNTYSVVIPLGAEIEQEDGTFERLTIKSVNNDKDYLVNAEALEKIGWVVAPTEKTTWDDVTLPSNLKTKGEEFLNKTAVAISSTIELTALDLSAANINLEAFFIYEYVNIISLPHNYNSKLLVKSITIPFKRPEETKITLGESKNSLTGISLGNKQDVDNVIKRVGIIEADYVTNKELPTIVDEKIENSSIIQQLPENIMTRVETTFTTKNEFAENVASTNNNYQELINKLDNKASNNDVLSITKKVEEIQTSTEKTIDIVEDLQMNGINQVTTETGFTFNKDGLKIDQSDSQVANIIDSAGNEVVDKNTASRVPIFYSGYIDKKIAEKVDMLIPYYKQTAVYAKNLIFEQFLSSKHYRLEEVTDSLHGIGLGFFYTGSLSYSLPDETPPDIISFTIATTGTTATIEIVGSDDVGIASYYYSIDNGITYVKQDSNNFIIRNLTENTSYTLLLYCVDTSGNKSDVLTTTFSTGEKTTIENILTNKTISTRTDFSTVLTENTTGTIYAAEDDDGLTYYYAGAATDNYVYFAGFYWRIIRINGDSSIRLIYQGTDPYALLDEASIGTCQFNTTAKSYEFVGYMYSEMDLTGFDYDSTIKEMLDEWYKNNLLSYETYIDNNAGFYGDKNYSLESGVLYFEAFKRLYENKAPTFKTTSNDCLYTTSFSSKGNQALTYPIGLITADEVAYAGGVYSESNTSYYLYTGSDFWTISPSNTMLGPTVFCLGETGELLEKTVSDSIGIRPVINLRSSVELEGEGTPENPYVIKEANNEINEA